MARFILNNIYRQSLDKYDIMAEKLEKKGKVDHLKANIDFRMSITDAKSISDKGITSNYIRRVT